MTGLITDYFCQKLKAYGFPDRALSLLQSYLCKRLPKSVINSFFNSWNDVITEFTLQLTFTYSMPTIETLKKV